MLVCKSGLAAEIPWSTDIEDALHRAEENGQPVLMEFTASWCVFCRKMEKNTFTNADVAQRISDNFVAVQVDADHNKDLVKDLGIKGLPAILIVLPDLTVIERISGFQTPEALIPKLDAVSATHGSHGKPAKMVSAQIPPKRPMKPASQLEASQPEDDQTRRPVRKELEFEAITQDETLRRGNRPSVDASRNPFLEDSSAAQATPADRLAADTDPESFFRTISREQEPQHDELATPAPALAPDGPAFDGLCIVTAVEERELVKGTDRHQTNYRGQPLYFSSSEAKAQFLASPTTYWPMLDGVCAMTLLNDDKRVAGNLEFAAVFRKRIWLFASQKAMKEFLQSPAEIAEEAVEIADELQH